MLSLALGEKKKVTETAKPNATLLHNQKQKRFERCESFARFLRLCLPLFDRLAIANREKLTTLTKTYVISFARETKRNQERGSKETEPTCQVPGSWWVVDKEMVSVSPNFPMHLCIENENEKQNEKWKCKMKNAKWKATIAENKFTVSGHHHKVASLKNKILFFTNFSVSGETSFFSPLYAKLFFPIQTKKTDSSPICNRLPHKGGLTRAIKTDPDHQEI